MRAPHGVVLHHPETRWLTPRDRAGIAAFAASLDRATVEFARSGGENCTAAFVTVSGRTVRFDREGDSLRLRALPGRVLATAGAVEDLVAIAKAHLVPDAAQGQGRMGRA